MARILDLTDESGAYGTRLLAELGHDVIRIESPRADAVRQMAPRLDAPEDAQASAFHQFWNAGKRSVALDLAHDKDRQALIALVADADAVVATLPLPIDEKDLLAANPRLVLVRLDASAPEICAYARSGLMAITGEPSASPVLMGGHIPLAAVGTYLAIATASALLAQAISGEGDVVDVSAQAALSSLAEQSLIEYQSAGEVLERRGSRGGITAVAGALACRDGHWMLCAPPNNAGWANFLALTQIPELMADESLAQEAARKEKKDFILDTVEAWSSGHDAEALVERAQALHVPATPITSPAHLVRDPQLEARGFLRPDPAHPGLLAPAGALAALFGTTMAPAPRLGQHTDDILRPLRAADT